MCFPEQTAVFDINNKVFGEIFTKQLLLSEVKIIFLHVWTNVQA